MASGFNNTPPASEYRKYTSWGRTRSPKNILSSHRSGVNADGTPKTLTTAGGAESFITENQRYLHVVVTAVSGATLKIEGEMYAAAVFSSGSPSSFSAIPLTDTQGNSMASVGTGHYLIEIGGLDRIKFTSVGGTSVTFYAACSTFSMA